MARWRVKFRDAFPEVFKTLQNDFGNCGQGAAFIALRDAYHIAVTQRDSDFVKRSLAFIDWVITTQREDMKAVCWACFVEHILEDLDRADFEFVRPFITSALREELRCEYGNAWENVVPRT